MVRNSTQDVESGASSTKNKRKASLPLIIALAVALVAAIVFMVIFIVYQNKYAAAYDDLELKNKLIAKAKAEIEAQKKRLGGLTTLAEEMLDTTTSTVPDMKPVLMKRTEVWGKVNGVELTPDKGNDFNIMQFNMLADKRCGLYDDPSNPETEKNEYTMKKENQHVLYWRYRLSLIIAEIVENKADIVTIQENDHHKVIENALNVRAKAKKDDDSKQSKDDIWKCEYLAKTKSPIIKYLPSDNNKKDGSTICWNVNKFTQDKEFKEHKAYESYEQTNLDGSKSTIDSGNIYVAVKLTHKNKKKNLIVVTTQLASEKTLGGEDIRIQQMKQLMKKMNEWKKDDTAIIFTGDLNALPTEMDRVNKKSQADDILLEKFNLEGKFYCQDKKEKGSVYIVEVKDNLFLIKGEDDKSHMITNKLNEFTLSFKDTEYTLPKNSDKYEWVSAINSDDNIVCQKVVDPNSSIPNRVSAVETFNLLPNLGGKTFYDSYGQKYVTDKYDENKPDSINMTIGEQKWTIKKGEVNNALFTAKPDDKANKGQCDLPQTYSGQQYEWHCRDLTDIVNFQMVWAQKRNDYKFNYPSAVYDYITQPEKVMDPNAVKDLKNEIVGLNATFGSVVKKAKETYDTNVGNAVDKIFSVDQPDQDNSKTMDLVSSQKQLSADKIKSEPLATYVKNKIYYTEDYIFATKELTPVAYLSYPWLDEKSKETFLKQINITGSLLNSNYPSDHLSLMTTFRFE